MINKVVNIYFAELRDRMFYLYLLSKSHVADRHWGQAKVSLSNKAPSVDQTFAKDMRLTDVVVNVGCSDLKAVANFRR